MTTSQIVAVLAATVLGGVVLGAVVLWACRRFWPVQGNRT